MKLYRLEMAEGVAGATDIGGRTTTLYSCMGIAMVNKDQKYGGLYHYPAKSLNKPGIGTTLLQMLNDIKPTEIKLTPATVLMLGDGSDPEDIDSVMTFLKSNSKADVAEKKLPSDETSARLYWKDGVPQYNGSLDGLPDYERTGMESISGTFSATRRSLGGGAWYYGVNAEKNLAQLLKVTVPSSLGSPGGGGTTVENKGTVAT